MKAEWPRFIGVAKRKVMVQFSYLLAFFHALAHRVCPLPRVLHERHVLGLFD